MLSSVILTKTTNVKLTGSVSKLPFPMSYAIEVYISPNYLPHTNQSTQTTTMCCCFCLQSTMSVTQEY